MKHQTTYLCRQVYCMRYFIFSLFLFCQLVLQAQFTGYNMVQVGRWDNDSLTSLGTQQFSNGWGWADSLTGREYAILGSVDSTYFIEVTNPARPVVRDVRAGRVSKSVWREYKTYKNYCYAVGDAGKASLQIFDMSYLPDSVHLVYDSDSIIMRSHTVYIDQDKLYCNSVITNDFRSFPVSVLSLADPENPELLGHLEPYAGGQSPAFVRCHDAYVRNDTLYCSGENAGVFIYNMKDNPAGTFISSITEYPENGYNHSGYLSDDGKIFVFTDENAGLGIKAYDMTDIRDPELLTVFRSSTEATAHNPYFIGRKLYVSVYHDGVYVFDLSNEKEAKVIAWYDTYPQNGNNYSGFEGCWGIYPFLPSGNLLAFDMTNGLFVLRMDATAGMDENTNQLEMLLFPNPANEQVTVNWNQYADEKITIEVKDMGGRTVFTHETEGITGVNQTELALEGFNKGIYFVQLTGAKTHLCSKLLLR